MSKSLKKLPGAVVEEIPPNTMKIIQDIPMLPGQKWASDKEVDDLLKKLPQQVKDSLLPFQLEGVRFGLRRRGCCLIADEMGLGKTLQVSIWYQCLHTAILPVLCMQSILVFHRQQNVTVWQVSMEHTYKKLSELLTEQH